MASLIRERDTVVAVDELRLQSRASEDKLGALLKWMRCDCKACRPNASVIECTVGGEKWQLFAFLWQISLSFLVGLGSNQSTATYPLPQPHFFLFLYMPAAPAGNLSTLPISFIPSVFGTRTGQAGKVGRRGVSKDVPAKPAPHWAAWPRTAGGLGLVLPFCA